MTHTFLPILIMLFVAVAIGGTILGLNWMVGRHQRNPAKLSPYESGVPLLDVNRKRVNVRFYQIAMLFILFDIEAAFLYPWAVIYRDAIHGNRPACSSSARCWCSSCCSESATSTCGRRRHSIGNEWLTFIPTIRTRPIAFPSEQERGVSSREAKERFDWILTRYPTREAALLPTLHLAQEVWGWISPEAVLYVGSLLDLSPATVFGVVSFYNMYNQKPVGKYHVQVCTNLSCMVNRAYDIYDHLCETAREARRNDEGRPLHRHRRRMPRLLRNRAGRADQQRLPREHERGENGRAPAATALIMDPIKILTANIDKPNSTSIDVYIESGGYQAAKTALKMTPDQVIQVVKDSELRGRGGAGFPTGAKWGFVPKNAPKPTYLLCNADESEPGTFKDRLLMEKDPHLLIEG